METAIKPKCRAIRPALRESRGHVSLGRVRGRRLEELTRPTVTPGPALAKVLSDNVRRYRISAMFSR